MAERNLRNLFGLIAKSVPAIDQIQEVTREGIPKAYIPYFFYKPPFGYPRYTDMVSIRRLAATPYVEMCINLILDEMSPIKWDIVTDDGVELNETKQSEIDHIKSFFENPNTNKESFDEVRRKYLRDVLEIDTGIINKIFNLKEEMVEIVARDGATFTKNPDIYGMITDRDDIVRETVILMNKKEESMAEFTPGAISSADVRERAAYFQYGWSTAARPVPFGKKELVWFEKNPRTDSIYGRGMVEILANTIQTFIYAIENDLEFFSDNQIPKGIIGLEGSNTEEIKAFKDQWLEEQRVKDTAGNWKKKMHQVPIVGKIPKFETIQFTSAEMELIEKQKWWAKMVWACFGVTASELGYTEDAKGMGNQIVQSSSFKKRTIYPLLRLEEYRINHEIIPEFYEAGKKSEIQKAISNGDSPDIAKERVSEMEKKKALPYQGLKFKFMVFDVEEETKKANLYKIQIDSGTRTINEIRKEEGLEELEWGSKDPQENMNQGFGNNDWGNPIGNEANKKKEESKPAEKKEEKAIESIESEEKATTIDNPLILRENERLTGDRLERSIVYLMNENEQKIKKMLEKEVGKETLNEIKSLDGLIMAIKDFLLFPSIKLISDAVIKNTFMSGWEDAEKQLARNLMVNTGAITFLQNYTFGNIKDLTNEIANDLRAELERGIIAGEGISKLKDRVGKVFNVGKNRAEMIARTETNNAENQGKLQAFKSTGKDMKKKWIATIDARTSEICKRLNGQVVGINENFKDSSGWEGPSPSAHVNCRSTMIFITEEELNQKDQLERENELAKQEEIYHKNLDKEIDIRMKEKEAEIKTRKENLLKKLENGLENEQ